MSRMLLLAAGLAAGITAPLVAQGWVDVERPSVVSRITPDVVRASSQVRVRIDGRVATVEVQEEFRNEGQAIAEGTYLYPMPGEAVFTDFSLWMGETEVRGEMIRAEQARSIYEEIVRKIRDPALLTYEGHGLIRARVFPIRPGETRKVVLRYTQVLDRAGDALRLRYAVGPRSPAREGRGDGGSRFRDAFSFRVTLPDSAVGTPYSPTHQITTRRNGGRVEVALEPDATGDVEIFLPLRRGLVGTSLVANASAGEDGFYMLLVAPPQSDEGLTVPRDLSLVVDVSGSMSGDKLDQAKAALTEALNSLRTGDRFRVIAFSSAVRRFREGLLPATAANLAAARAWVDELRANGGTNIAGALDEVLGTPADAERLPLIVFLTDGVPSVGEQAPDRLAENAAAHIDRYRIFTVGVGHDVNTYLLDRLSREGHGSAEYVAPDANVEVAVGGLLSKIQHPALVNLHVVQSPVRLVDSYPGDLPDLFFGEELVVFGRYHGTGAGPIVVEGERNGRRERFTVQASFPASEEHNDFIPRLWAARRIGELTRQIRIEGATDALINEVRDLGLRYGILTEYTSYLVQEPGMDRPMPVSEMRRDEASRQLMGGAAAATGQTGAPAFQRARESADLAATKTLSANDAVANESMGRIAAASPSALATRRVGGRLFVLRGTVWTDAAQRDGLQLISVAPYSAAYFALVRALPEITPFLTVGDEVVIAGRRASVKVSSGGSQTWSPGELERLVRQFRGA